MNDSRTESPSLVSRLLRDPVALRRRSRILALCTALLSAVAGSGFISSGSLSGALTGLAWLLVPVAAAGIGTGDAFFLRHGVGERRVAWSTLLGALIAVAGCVLLAVINTAGNGGTVLAGALYFILVAGVIALLAGGIAIAARRGSGYLSRRIQDVDDSGW